jgi:hypothetical protein
MARIALLDVEQLRQWLRRRGSHFVALQVRLHVLCRQERYFVAQFLKLATEVVCAGASLHSDQAWRYICQRSFELISRSFFS